MAYNMQLWVICTIWSFGSIIFLILQLHPKTISIYLFSQLFSNPNPKKQNVHMHKIHDVFANRRDCRLQYMIAMVSPRVDQLLVEFTC